MIYISLCPIKSQFSFLAVTQYPAHIRCNPVDTIVKNIYKSKLLINIISHSIQLSSIASASSIINKYISKYSIK